MADEMDEPKGEETSNSAPEGKTAETVKVLSDGDDAAETSSLETATAIGPIVEGTSGIEVVAEASDGVEAEPPSSSTAAAGSPNDATAQSGAQKPPAASAGASPRSSGSNSGAGRVEGGELDRPGLDLLYDVELDATLQFGSKEMLLRDVLELGPGDVVELDRHIAQPVDLVVGDRIVARGEVVVASGNFALRVTEVATPQMRLESIRCLF